MNESQAGRAPTNSHPSDDVAALAADARIFDIAAGTSSTSDEWLAACSARESRPIDECRESLMNAIARGDVRVLPGESLPDR